jgi:hypothetical protein
MGTKLAARDATHVAQDMERQRVVRSEWRDARRARITRSLSNRIQGRKLLSSSRLTIEDATDVGTELDGRWSAIRRGRRVTTGKLCATIMSKSGIGA